MLDTIARLAGAIVVAFLAITVLRSGKRSTGAWIARLSIGLPLLLATLWIVLETVPLRYERGYVASTLSVVTTAVLVAGLAVEELIGSDLRRMFGI